MIFYHLKYSDNCLNLYCYIHHILAHVTFGLPLVFLVELRILAQSGGAVEYTDSTSVES